MNCWIGVASREHVRAAVAGGFCQLCHGKAAALRRLQSGDRIIYYSPREAMGKGQPVQAFTAIGEVSTDAPQQADQEKGFRPFRLGVRYFPAAEAPIRPLLSRLSFTREQSSWGYVFRRGIFRIDSEDLHLIAEAMGIGCESP
jgi:hypothetical protein